MKFRDQVVTYGHVKALLEQKQNSWDAVKPLVIFGLVLAPALFPGGLESVSIVIDRVGMGVTLADVADKIGAVFRIAQKKGECSYDHERAAFANGLLVLTAYFDTLRREKNDFWNALELIPEEQQYLVAEAKKDFEEIREHLGVRCRSLHHLVPADPGLTSFYDCLSRRLVHMAKGLSNVSMAEDLSDIASKAVLEHHHQYIQLRLDNVLFYRWSNGEVLQLLMTMGEQQREKSSPSFAGQERESSPISLPLLPLLRSDGFKGRKQEMKKLYESLLAGENPVLCGPGGIGKTELVSFFGRKVYTHGHVYFVRFQGSFYNTVVSGIASGISGLLSQGLNKEELYSAVIARLRLLGDRDILIIDNVDKEGTTFGELTEDPAYKDLSELPVRLVLTTRYESEDFQHIGPLLRQEQHEIFSRYGVTISETVMDDLIDAVQGHTLTVDVIARTLIGGWAPVTPDDLLVALQYGSEWGEFPNVASSYNRSNREKHIYAHLRSVFQVSNIPSEAKRVLQCAVLLPQNGIPSEIFGRALPKEYRQYIEPLARHGWLSLEHHFITIHPVIRLVCRMELQLMDECCSYATCLFENFLQGAPTVTECRGIAEMSGNAAELLKNYQVQNLAEQKIFWISWNRVEVRLFSILGLEYNSIRDNKKILEYYQCARNFLKGRLSKNSLDLAELLNSMGYFQGLVGDCEGQLKSYSEALRIRKKKLHKHDPNLAQSYLNVGSCYYAKKEYAKAQTLMSRAILIRDKEDPPNQPARARAYNNLGCCYGAQGEHQKALTYKKRALEIWKDSRPDSLDLARAYSNLGNTHRKLNQYADARECYQETLRIWEKVQSYRQPDQPELCSLLSQLCISLKEMEQATEYARLAVEYAEKTPSVSQTDLLRYQEHLFTLQTHANSSVATAIPKVPMLQSS